LNTVRRPHFDFLSASRNKESGATSKAEQIRKNVERDGLFTDASMKETLWTLIPAFWASAFLDKPRVSRLALIASATALPHRMMSSSRTRKDST